MLEFVAAAVLSKFWFLEIPQKLNKSLLCGMNYMCINSRNYLYFYMSVFQCTKSPIVQTGHSDLCEDVVVKQNDAQALMYF